MTKIVLASGSPRRQELLRRIGIENFTVRVPHVEEYYPDGLTPREIVTYISREKSFAVPSEPDEIVITADTMVFLDDARLGKPRDEEEAAAMLRALSGKTHQVFTGVSVLAPSGALLTETDRSDVTFCSLTEDEILSYVRSGEPMDKAGAYACQGRAAFWITRLEGSHTSVIGLPLARVREMLLRVGFPLIPGL